MYRIVSRVIAAKAVSSAAGKVLSKVVDEAVSRADKKANPHRTRKTVASSAVPSAAIGGVLMYLFDPKNGAKRRQSLFGPLQRRGTMADAPSSSGGATVNDIQERSRQVIKTAGNKPR